MTDEKSKISFSETSFPPAPWTMKGFGFQTVGLIDIHLARIYIPDDIDLIEVLPGKTIGGIYIAKYNENSTLPYHELAIICGLAKYKEKYGTYMSHVYVDNIRSQKSGPMLWGWPKQYADFEVKYNENNTNFKVSQDKKVLLNIEFSNALFYVKAPMKIPAFGIVDGSYQWFNGKGKMQLGFCSSNIYVPDTCEFHHLNLTKNIFSLHAKDLDMTYGNITKL